MQPHLEMPAELASLYQKMVEEVEKAKRNGEADPLALIRNCIDITQKEAESLETYISKYTFLNEKEEIHFYKRVRPRFYCQLAFYLMRYDLEMDRPPGVKEQLKYFERELENLRVFFEKNRNFFHYLRSGATHLDSRFLLQNKKKPEVLIHSSAYDPEAKFSAPYDLRVAIVLANELLREFLESEIASLQENKQSSPTEPLFKVNTSLSVAQLGCFLRLLFEEKVLSNPNQTELIHFFASHFTSLKTEQISGTSLRSKYYNIEPSASQCIKDLLFQLLNRLKKI
jgi:hypothetical protein